MERRIRRIFEGDNLKGCIWNIYLEEIELPDEALISLIDKPPHNFDYLNYLEMLLGRYKMSISNFPDGFQLVIQG